MTITVIGRTHAGEKIRAALAEQRGRPLTVLCAWDSLTELSSWSRQATVPWVHVEAADAGAAVGPLFHPGRRGCFACYLQRRAANSLVGECRPYEGRDSLVIETLVRAVRRLALGEPTLGMSQLVVAASLAFTHPFLPVPTCRACLPKADTLAQPLGIAAAVSSRLGIVQRVEVSEGPFDGLTTCRAVGAGMKPLTGTDGFNHGFAVDRDPERAYARAVGEALERYAAAFVPDDLLRSASEGLSRPHLSPMSLAAPNAAANGQFSWVEARRLADDRATLVPAAAVYLPYRRRASEARTGTQSSTGLALALAEDDAIRHGLGEVIERDAFMRAWRGRSPVSSLKSASKVAGLHLTWVPCRQRMVVVTAFLEQITPPYTAVGLCADLDADRAAERAFLEAAAVRAWLSDVIADPASQPQCPPRTLHDHAKCHALVPQFRAARARWLSAPLVDAPPPTRWADVLDASPGACVADLTTSDLRLLGAHAVRVLVPGLVPLDEDSLAPRLAGDPAPHPLA